MTTQNQTLEPSIRNNHYDSLVYLYLKYRTFDDVDFSLRLQDTKTLSNDSYLYDNADLFQLLSDMWVVACKPQRLSKVVEYGRIAHIRGYDKVDLDEVEYNLDLWAKDDDFDLI